MVMGDLVMTEDQVNLVMSEALNNGLEVTALHNHFFWDNPKVYFMHIGGSGDETKVATAVGKVFAKLKSTSGGKGVVPRANIHPDKTNLDTKALDAVVGARGEMSNGVYKFTIGKTTRMPDAFPKGLGIATDGECRLLPGHIGSGPIRQPAGAEAAWGQRLSHQRELTS
jgi:hypothetical protein